MSKVKCCKNFSEFIRTYINLEVKFVENNFHFGNCSDYSDHTITVYPKSDCKYVEQAERYFSLHNFPVEFKVKKNGYHIIIFKHDTKQLKNNIYSIGNYYEYLYDYYTYRDGYLKDLKDFLKEIRFSINTDENL